MYLNLSQHSPVDEVMNDSSMEWLAYAKSASSPEERTVAVDGKNCSFLLEWKKVDILSPELAAFKRELSEVAAQKAF